MARCYADHCVLDQGHEPEPHRARNGYEWASAHPQRAGRDDGNEQAEVRRSSFASPAGPSDSKGEVA